MPKIIEKRLTVASNIENLDSLGMPDGDPEKTESVTACYLKIAEGIYEISYREETDGAAVDTDIVIEEDKIRVVRRGAIESDMIFSEGKRHLSLYKVSPYSFDAEIFTRKIRRSTDEDTGRIDIFYTMKIGGADKNVRMKIFYE